MLQRNTKIHVGKDLVMYGGHWPKWYLSNLAICAICTVSRNHAIMSIQEVFVSSCILHKFKRPITFTSFNLQVMGEISSTMTLHIEGGHLAVETWLTSHQKPSTEWLWWRTPGPPSSPPPPSMTSLGLWCPTPSPPGWQWLPCCRYWCPWVCDWTAIAGTPTPWLRTAIQKDVAGTAGAHRLSGVDQQGATAKVMPQCTMWLSTLKKLY